MLVSIIVPVYNVEKYLPICIESILNQSYKNIELLLIDDGSTDNSLKICNNYKLLDDRVKVIHINNSGVSNARNVGLDNATGKYVCFVDSDDIIEIDYVKTLYNMIINNECSVVYSNYKLYYSNNKIVDKIGRLDEGLYDTSKLNDRLVDDGTLTGILFGSACCAIYNIEIIRKFNIKFFKDIKINEDGIFNISYLEHVDKLYYTIYNGYLYRQWKTSKINELTWNNELDKATLKIKQEFDNLVNLDAQLSNRNYSILFWNSINVSNLKGSSLKSSKLLKKMINENFDFEKLNMSLNFDKISRSKKILISLLLRKHYYLFCIIMKRIYPILNKVLNH